MSLATLVELLRRRDRAIENLTRVVREADELSRRLHESNAACKMLRDENRLLRYHVSHMMGRASPAPASEET